MYKTKAILLYFAICISWTLLLFSCSPAKATVRIAIIDTGVNKNFGGTICDNGASYTTVSNEDATDFDGHGTEVATVLHNSIPSALKYCVIPIKVFDKKLNSKEAAVAIAIDTAVAAKADIINISLSSVPYIALEKEAVKKALDKNVLIIIAAGNDGLNLDIRCSIYPVCYDGRAIIVGYNDKKSNKGKVVDYYASGTAVKKHKISESGEKVYAEGSSFAAPRVAAFVAVNLATFRRALEEENRKKEK